MAGTGTPGHTAVTGGSLGSRSRPTREVPPLELPASVDELAAEAAAQLGWDGVVLPQQRILGRNVCVVARLRTDVHAERIAMGVGPVADRASVSTWCWPELADSTPGEAVDIVGVLSVERHWRTALASTVPFARYGDAAMVLPTTAIMTADYVDNCLPRARVYGLSVVSADQDAVVGLDVTGRGLGERTLLPADPVSRWVNEVVYAQLLATDTEVAAVAE